MTLNWKPIIEAPSEGEFLVRGSSGYIHHTEFIVLAYRAPEYRGERWLFPGGEDLIDFGWVPTHFTEVPQ